MAPGFTLLALSHLLCNRRTQIVIALLPLAVTDGAVAQAATYRVGPGRSYTTIGAVAGLLNPGDVVEVDGNASYPSVTFARPGSAADPIVIRGIRVNGLRPVISGGANTVHFRTDEIGSGADHYVMEGFDITGGSSRCVFHQSDDLRLRDVVVHDCPAQGILGADWGSGSITIEHSEVYRCGSGTQNHQLYIGMDEDNHPDGVFRLQYSWIHDATGGNNVKSRSARNEIYYNRIEGAYYHEIELIGAECCAESIVREDSDVVGNLFVKEGSNANFAVTRFGGDGTAQTWGRYRFVNNTVVVTGTAAVFRLFDGLESVEMHNNVFYRSGAGVTIVRTVEAVWASGERFAGSNNWISTGSTSIPTPWTGTLTGANPGFANAAGGDYSLAAGSPLLNAGNETLSSPAGSPFPGPLFPPAFHPPGAPGAFGTPNQRPDDGQIDIGAWERGSGATPQLSVADVSVTEGSSGSTSAVFTITLAPAAATAVTVNVATGDGTATAGSDYASASSAVLFSAGDTSKSFSVAVTPDAVDESDETFYLALSGATGGASVSDGQATGTIVDDDLPAVTLAINDVTITEGNSGTANATFTVTLSAASTSAVTVAYATANGTATAGSDYMAHAGNLSFAAGQTVKTIVVVVNGDTTVEPNETFTVTLSSPSGATLADAQGQGTITNDDSVAPPSEPVVWTSAVGVAVSGSNLTKTASTAWANAAAISTKSLFSGDGAVEFTAGDVATHRMLGLSYGSSNNSYEEIDFAVYLAGATFYVWENNFNRGSFGAYVVGDRFTIAVASGAVRYYRNGTLFYTSTQALNYPLLVDAALYHTNATLKDATLVGAWTTTPSSGAEPVVWTAVAGVSVSGSSLTKTATTAWANAGAVSTKSLPSGDGAVEFTAGDAATHRMLGLSYGSANDSYQEIDFAVYLAGAAFYVWENNFNRGNFGTYVLGDRFKVAVASGVVKYYRNGTLFYTSTQAPVFPLLVDASLYNTGASLKDAALTGSWSTSGTQPAAWTSAVGVTVSGSSLTKTAATGWTNAAAVSTRSLLAGDGAVEFTAGDAATHRMLGLSKGSTSNSYEEIDFAIYLAGSALYVWENNFNRGTFGSYAATDRLKVSVTSGVVRYYRNGILFYTSTQAPAYPLLVDTSLYHTGANLKDVALTGSWQ